MKTVSFLLMLFAGICFASGAWAQTKTDMEFSLEMMHYAESKPESFFKDTVDFIDSKSQITGEFRDILVAFYSKCYQNDDFRDAMTKQLEASSSQKADQFFAFVAQFNIDDFLKAQKVGAHVNDLEWAAYFASGETQYLDYLFGVYTTHMNEDKDVLVYMAGSSAGWSLASNSHQFPAVAEYLKGIRTVENAGVVDDLLNTPPSEIRQRSVDFVKLQHDKGVW